MAKLMIEGWFSVDKDYPDISRAILKDEVFKKSVRCLDTDNIRPLSNSERLVGSFIRGIKVTGFVDTSGSLTPFFVTQFQGNKLRRLLENQTIPSL